MLDRLDAAYGPGCISRTQRGRQPGVYGSIFFTLFGPIFISACPRIVFRCSRAQRRTGLVPLLRSSRCQRRRRGCGPAWEEESGAAGLYPESIASAGYRNTLFPKGRRKILRWAGFFRVKPFADNLFRVLCPCSRRLGRKIRDTIGTKSGYSLSGAFSPSRTDFDIQYWRKRSGVEPPGGLSTVHWI